MYFVMLLEVAIARLPSLAIALYSTQLQLSLLSCRCLRLGWPREPYATQFAEHIMQCDEDYSELQTT